jgi:hypothetical protein
VTAWHPADLLGWLATLLFAASYRFTDQRMLRWTQATAAVLWVGYGAARQAVPVVVANLLVAGMALYSSLRTGSKIRRARDEDRSRTSLPYS